MDRIHELRVFPRSPQFRLHPMLFPRADPGIRWMAAPKVDLFDVVLCLEKDRKEQI